MSGLVALFLRGVNVGGKRRLPMAELTRSIAVDLGCAEPRSYLQSGNLVVREARSTVAEDVRRLIGRRWGLDVDVLSFTPGELDDVRAKNPYPARAAADPQRIHVALLRGDVAAAWVAEVGEQHGTDSLAAGPRCVYLSYGRDSRNSPLAGVLRHAPFIYTARNWNTVSKVSALVTGSGATSTSPLDSSRTQRR